MYAKKIEEQSNLNPHFNGVINESKDLYAFIDESGDEGFDFSKSGTSKWFNVSAFVSEPSVSRKMVTHLKEYCSNKFPGKPIMKMDSKELKHNQKKDIFTSLSSFNFSTIHSLFYKPDINPKDSLYTYPSMYFVGIKNVIERISWLTKQYGKERTHLIISSRNSIKKVELKTYLFQNSVMANKNLTYMNKLGIIKLSTFDQRPQLIIADYVAYTLRMVVEKIGNPPTPEPYYFDMLQKDKLFRSDHKFYGGVWRNGLKCTPDNINLLRQSGILDEGSHKV